MDNFSIIQKNSLRIQKRNDLSFNIVSYYCSSHTNEYLFLISIDIPPCYQFVDAIQLEKQTICIDQQNLQYSSNLKMPICWFFLESQKDLYITLSLYIPLRYAYDGAHYSVYFSNVMSSFHITTHPIIVLEKAIYTQHRLVS